MRKKILLIISIIIAGIFIFSTNSFAAPFLSDKGEEEVFMEVPGARAICQTDDGYVWIAQYSGLIRYDSKEQITYKDFEENGGSYKIINVRSLSQKDNVLYILTYKNLFKYSNNKFSFIANIEDLTKEYAKDDDINEFEDLYFDKSNDLIYISSDNGLFIYDIKNESVNLVLETKGKNIRHVTSIEGESGYYYQLNNDGIVDNNHNMILDITKINAALDETDVIINEISIYDKILLIGTTKGLLKCDLSEEELTLEKYNAITDQVNAIYYSESQKMIFVGCEKNGVYCIDIENDDYSQVSGIANSTQLVDLMVDYEGNLWIASNNTSSSGVSIITQNSFYKMLYGDKLWQNVFVSNNRSRTVYDIKKYKDYLYICLGKSGLVIYDLKNNTILSSSTTKNKNVVTDAVDNYFIAHGTIASEAIFDCRSVDIYNNKVYFAGYELGLVEYDPTTQNVLIYDNDYLTTNASVVEERTGNYVADNLNNIRYLKSFGSFLAVGYQSGGVYKFDGTSVSVYCTGKSTMYISSDSNGNVVFNNTGKIIRLNDDFTVGEEIETEKNVEGNRLKFLYDGNRIYYNLNSRLFYSENGGPSKEIVFPYIQGSIVEIAKVKSKTVDGKIIDKYIIATTNQLFVTNSLEDSNLDSDRRLIDYEVYDSTNGLKTIQSNTSGYFDEEELKYYFQTTDGVLVYDLEEDASIDVPTKIAINSILLDGERYYGTDINVSKDTYRIEFNLSILGFKPNKGHTVYYKLDGVDSDYVLMSDSTTTISYTNVNGGNYQFHIYILDSNGQKSNQVDINLNKEKKVHEQVWFWVLLVILSLLLVVLLNYLYTHRRIKIEKKREEELKGITIESIEAIARTIDAKDTYTNGHSIRVGHFSRIIAEELGVQGDELENLYYIALLHDIGKIGIPDAILNKPGRLTDEEFAIMKSHTTKGANILKDISTIPNIVEGAKYHHEKYGGGGYPEGLKGEEIPYIARIICCADCFDAMATRRVYKDPYPKEKIISEFEKCKGTQFDPKMADVVIKLINEGKLKTE